MFNNLSSKSKNINPLGKIEINYNSAFDYYYPGCSDIILKENSKICSICLFPINSKKARPNVCDHLFCYSCLFIWYKSKRSCPYCRRSFSKIIII